MTLDKNVEDALAQARDWAEKGEATVMNALLSTAQGYAQKVGQNISLQVSDIRELVKK